MKKTKSIFIILLLCLLTLTGIISVTAQSLRSVEYYSPPGQPFQVGSQETAVINSTGLVYSASSLYAVRFAVIDPNTNTPIAFIEAPPTAGTNSVFYSVVNQTKSLAYFFNSGANNIFVVDGRASSSTFNKLLPTLNFSGQLVRGVAFDETRSRMYVTTVSPTSSVTGQINVIDADPASATFHQILNVVPMPSGAPGHGIAVNPVTNKIYVAAPLLSGGTIANAGVYVLDGNTLNLVKIAGTSSAFALLVNSSANLIYASTSFANTLFAIDGTTDTLLTTISNVPGVSTNESLAVNQTTGRVYVAGSTLSVIDGNLTSPTFNTLLSSINISNGVGIVVDESLNKIAVALLLQEGNTIIIDGGTNTISATIVGQSAPSDVALNPATDQIFVANQLFNVQRINLASNALVATIPTGADSGAGVVSSLNNFYYSPRSNAITDIPYFDANGLAGTVSGLPHNNGRLLRVFQNSATNRLYAVNSARTVDNTAAFPSYVAVINPATNSVIANVPVLSQCLDGTANEATNKIYIYCAGLGTAFPGGISVIDGATNAVSTVNVSAFPTNLARFFNAPIVANPVTNKIYIRSDSGQAGVINGATDVASLLPYTDVIDIDINTTLNRIYFLTGNSLRVIDGANDTEIANIPLPSVAFRGAAVNQTTGRIFVTNPSQDTVTVINANTNTIIGTVPTGDNPSSVAVNEVDNRVYVGNSNGSAHGLTFIDGNTLNVRKTLSLPLSPGRIDVSPATKRLYISSASGIAAGVMVINDTLSSAFDFDGDGKTDIGIFRPSAGEWWINYSNSGQTFAVQFGMGTDRIVPGDYTGDGKTDIAFYRPSNNLWYILRSEDNSFFAYPFGSSGDIAVPADYDGDGKTDTAVFRESNLTWYIQKSSGGFDFIGFGVAGDKPVVADYDGDGKADVAITRFNNGNLEWWIRRSSDGQIASRVFGENGDKAVQGDYTGDGKADIAIFRPSTGFWYIVRSEDASFFGFPFGSNGDQPTPGDYDGDGKIDPAVFRDSNKVWYQQRSTQGFTAITFGSNGDQPIPTAYVP